MAKNRTLDGELITVAAPHAVVSGRFVVLNATTGFGGVAQSNADSGANVVLEVGTGVYTFDKPNALSTLAAIGANAHWDNTNNQVTISATSNVLIGQFTAAVANTDVTASVRLRRF
jgi:predicted RecA/RadA family phage recombinase